MKIKTLKTILLTAYILSGFMVIGQIKTWSRNGNIVSDTDYIGSTNSKRLNFRLAGEHAGYLDYVDGRTFLGFLSGDSTLNSAADNTGFGWATLARNIIGAGNSAFGVKALTKSKTSYNTAIGSGALEELATGQENTATGAYSMTAMSSGNGNTVNGRYALANATSGDFNVAIGWRPLYNSSICSDNTAVGGYGCLLSNTTGSRNTALGSQAGFNNDGSDNILIGYKAGFAWTGVSSKLAIGNNDNHYLITGDFANDSINLNGKVKIQDGSQGSGKVLTSDANGVATWSTVATGASTFTINGTSMSTGNAYTVTAAANTLTGTALNSTIVTSSLTTAGTFTTGVWQATPIQNAYLANSTISGISLGSNLFNHTVGYGLSGSSYNGSAAQAWLVDSTKLASRLFTAASYQTKLTGTGFPYSTGGTISYTTSIPNSSLANSTISGVALGGTLSNLTNGYGINTFTYTGAAAKTVTADTTVLASKLYVTAKIGTAYISTVTTTGISGAAAVTTGTLNIPRYDNATSLSSLTTATNLTSIGTLTAGAVPVSLLTGTVLATQGGTGITTFTTGDILQANSATTFTRTPSVAAGGFWRSAGTNSLSAWSTSLWPNTIAVNSILFATATNSVGVNANFNYDGSNFNLAGPTAAVRIGGAIVLGTAAATGTTFYPTAQNNTNLNDQTNGNPTVFKFYCNTAAAYGLSIGNAPTNATAKIHFQAGGTATASTGLIKAASGTLMTTPEAGEFLEYDGTNFYGTPNTTISRWPFAFNSVQYVAPTTGNTVTATAQVANLVCNPAGTLLALTITFPSSPINGQPFGIAISQIITTLTLNGSGTDVIDGTITTSSINSNGSWVYVSAAVNGGATGIWFKKS